MIRAALRTTLCSTGLQPAREWQMYGDDREPVPEKPAIVRRAFAGDNKGFHYLNDKTVEIGGLGFYGAQ